MKMPTMTILYRETSDGKAFIGMCPELLGVFSQGSTIDELRNNICDAAKAMMAHNKWEMVKESKGFFKGGTVYEMDLVSGVNSPFEIFPPTQS